MEPALARSSSRPRPSSRPTTPLRPSSRSSIREAHGYGTSISNAGYTQPAINALEPQFAELADSMADLEANFMHLQLMHESLTRFSESFASFLYGLNMNAFCVDFPEAPIADSFRRAKQAEAQKEAEAEEVRRANDAEATFMNNANKRACAKQGVRGLYNLGQTCYLNVILQTLLHDPILNAYFLGNGHQSHDCTLQDCIGCAVAEAFADFNSSDKAEGFAALNLLLASWRASPTLAGYHQQDAHEYYQFLVDKLHTSTEGHVDDHDQGCSCFFHQTFYGKLKSSVMCDNCGNITKTEDPMLDLSLDVQVQAKKRAMGGGVGPSATPTLNGCLESFTSPERLMAGVYNCSECGGTPQKATKRLRIKKLPAILCMQLKRFEHSSAVSEKVEGRVDFPLSINMLPYTTHRHREDLDKSKFVYDLSSAVVHKGKLDAGHYYVYCKQGDQWVLFNDDQVTAATEAEVLNADAYLLFYNLRLFTAPLQ
ncbi:hypothetical protein KXX16_000084 [Aspergillus fumigatus]|nr:hypothetical protein KXX45_009280 [Aspergillus fumigatus]KAH1292692.1 hypothetical protein KXX48_006149 [Aspergillus fumigatus]KAH1326885.1 hypothetical protein KXX38_005607 [Aspergillus fumigatus]KAH1334081.1 hypothetical protein KXX47_000007 [Aspergillus fumigatus]KAH1359418.1 hypothetical protein KXX63_007861 [Aspergillus fumigatus]